MLRTALLRSTRATRSVTAVRTYATPGAAHPTATSTSTSVSAQLAPGQEIDPQLDGYPQLPYISLQRREAKGWWDQQERKNFGEVFHEEEDALSMWSPDQHKTSGPSAMLQLATAFAAVGLFAYGLSLVRPERPVSKRLYPFGGLEAELGGHNAARKESEEDEE